MAFKTEPEADDSCNHISDLCPAEDVDSLLQQHPDIQHLIDVDWSGVSVPDPAPAPSPTSELPDTTVFHGMHLFDVQIDMSGNHKKTYVMSSKLNKLFVDMDKVVPIKVKWDGAPGLSIRGLMVFTQADRMRFPVNRCVTHKDINCPVNKYYDHRKHVLACENSDTRYEMDPVSQRYSFVVPLALQQGAESAQINIKFTCKTSCPGGLNRAPTDVIFTLEDLEGSVLGRQKISVKICSCPKRDRDREEEVIEQPNKKRKKTTVANQVALPSKKIKAEEDEGEGVSFLVTCKTPQIAEGVKNLIKTFEETVRSEVVTQKGAHEPPLLTITENVSTIPHPYGQF